MSVSDSAASVCLIKSGHKVYQWSLQQISEFVVSLQRALGLNTLDTPIHCMHMLSELSQIIPQLVNIISGFFQEILHLSMWRLSNQIKKLHPA